MEQENIYIDHLSDQPETMIDQELSTHTISKQRGMPTSELPPEPMSSSAPMTSGEGFLLLLVLGYCVMKRWR